jgi:hypothetical protein
MTSRSLHTGLSPHHQALTQVVLEEIPNDSTAAPILLEHHLAVPLRDAIARAAASGSVTASSVRSTWSKSGSCRPVRPRNCTPSRPPEAPNNPGGMKCLQVAESHAAHPGAYRADARRARVVSAALTSIAAEINVVLGRICGHRDFMRSVAC